MSTWWKIELVFRENKDYICWWMKTNWPLSKLHPSELLPKEHNTGLLNQLLHYKCNCSKETKMTKHTTYQYYEKPNFDGNPLDGDIVRRIQADSFGEVWAWNSSKKAYQFKVLTYSTYQSSIVRDKTKDCSFQEAFATKSPSIQTLIKEFKCVIFGKNESEIRDTSLLMTVLHFLVNQHSKSAVLNNFLGF